MIIYLVLAAQYESLKDPLIILITVPLSICGALLPLALGYATMNIYTQVGLVTLIGLISKHGILMVEFANELQMHQGLTRRAAILQAAQIRLRPVLMTTGAMVFGLIPLLFASGAGCQPLRSGIGDRVRHAGGHVVHPVCAADGVYAAGARSRGGVAPAT